MQKDIWMNEMRRNDVEKSTQACTNKTALF